jgi:hypothetical protein
MSVAPGWVLAMCAAFAGGADLVGGPLRRERGQKVADELAGLQDSLGFLPWPYGANCGFRACAAQ